MSVTILSIEQLRGYTGRDHLLDDSELQSLVGKSYRSVGDIKRLAALRDAEAPVWVEYRVSGEVRCFTL